MTTREEQRKQWKTLKTTIADEEYEKIWEAFEAKQYIGRDNIYTKIKQHVMRIDRSNTSNPERDENALVLNQLNSKQRKETHALCDKMGLLHVSKDVGNERLLYIYVPNDWCWEFSKPNTLSQPYEQKYHKPKRRTRECDSCGATSDETTLFRSCYISGTYCEDCLDELSDGEGGVFSDHKFEEI
jgi:hypothetical protein